MSDLIDFQEGTIVRNQLPLYLEESDRIQKERYDREILSVRYPKAIVLEVGICFVDGSETSYFYVIVRHVMNTELHYYDKKIFQSDHLSLLEGIQEGIDFASSFQFPARNESLYMVFLENTEKTKDACEIVVTTSEEEAHQKAINRYKLYQTWYVYHTKQLTEIDGYTIQVQKQ